MVRAKEIPLQSATEVSKSTQNVSKGTLRLVLCRAAIRPLYDMLHWQLTYICQMSQCFPCELEHCMMVMVFVVGNEKHGPCYSFFSFILRTLVVTYNWMQSYLFMIPVGSVNFILKSAGKVLGEVQDHTHCCWRKRMARSHGLRLLHLPICPKKMLSQEDHFILQLFHQFCN